jgi:hypothetical protein
MPKINLEKIKRIDENWIKDAWKAGPKEPRPWNNNNCVSEAEKEAVKNYVKEVIATNNAQDFFAKKRGEFFKKWSWSEKLNELNQKEYDTWARKKNLKKKNNWIDDPSGDGKGANKSWLNGAHRTPTFVRQQMIDNIVNPLFDELEKHLAIQELAKIYGENDNKVKELTKNYW